MDDYRYNTLRNSYTSGFYNSKNKYNYKMPIKPIEKVVNFNFDDVEKLTHLPTYNEDYEVKVKWISLSKKNNNFKIFPDKFLPENFNQGDTGLCFFFSCLASIAGIPGLIYQLFGNNDNWRDTKEFIVYLFYKNERKTIIINDNFPFDSINNSWIWSVPSGNELFAKILEKAYLKYKLTYENLGDKSSLKKKIHKIIFDGGQEKEAMKILINAKENKKIYSNNSKSQCSLNNHNIKTSDCDKIFNDIKNYFENKNALITLARKFDNNATSGHAYSVIGAWEVGQGNNKKKILCIKNPWDYGSNNQEKFDFNSLNNSMKNFPDLINFNKKYFNSKNNTNSYSQYDYIVGNDFKKKRSSVFVAPLDYLIQNGLESIEAHVPDYKVDFPSVKLELELYNKLDQLFKKVQTNNVKNVFDSTVDGFTISTRVLSVGDKNIREIISNFHNQNFYTITKNGESYCEIERRADGNYNIQSMSQLFEKDYMDNNCLLINRKTGKKQIVSLKDLIGVDEEEKNYFGYDLFTFEHSIKPFPINNDKPEITSNNSFKIEPEFKNYYQNTNEIKEKTKNNNDFLFMHNIKLKPFRDPRIKTAKKRITKKWTTIDYTNGYYNGMVLNNKRHGNGKMYYNDGDYMDGIWSYDNFERGNAKITYDKGYYKGEYSFDKREGKGKMYYNDGDYLDGYWINDNFQDGTAKITYNNGYFEGECLNGKRNGEGTYYFNDGSYLTGNYKDDKMHGKFKRISRSGSIDYEEYVYGKKKSKCSIF